MHDRVQQAAYTLIDKSQKRGVHLQIGRNLLERIAPEQRAERLFEIVDHLNYGTELIIEQSERNEIAKLNLIAGQKAKAAIAYSTAKKYLATAREWLAATSWQINYDLTLDLYLETTEVAYLCGDFEDVEQWAAIVLQEAKTTLDIVKAYEVKIQTDMAQRQLLKAINTALQVLQQIGISFPETPSQLDIRLELNTIRSLFSGKQIAELLYLPEMTEPNHLAAMRILSSITLAAYIAAPELMPLLVSKQVNLLIQYGNAFMSPFVYANFGLILCGTIGDIESGYQFGQLALGLLSQSHTHTLKARTLLIVNDFIIHWKKHIRELLQPLLEGYQIGLETGDLEFSAYCAHVYCVQFFVLGKELVEVEREMTIYSEAICQIKQEAALTWTHVWQQTVLNLMGYSVNPCCLIGEFYNEEIELPQQEAANDGTSIFIVYFNKLFLCYLFSKYLQAVENSIIAERYLIHITATPVEPLYYLYDSLARLATYSKSCTQVQEEILKKFAFDQKKMKSWAHHAPMNYLHKYHLLEAEKARVLGQLLEAEGLYEQAIRGARENGYIQEEALAYELAAKHYLARDLERVAQLYMKEAHYCYERWGAAAKVKDLEDRYPQLFPQSSNIVSVSVRTTTRTTSNTSHIALDLAAVMKASQAISSEIELEKLLHSLMQILIENAGAQTGYLLLENVDEWTIEAACELRDGKSVCATQVLQSTPMTNRLSEPIVQYVIRTHEPVILNDATREGKFINDPYLQRHEAKSVLCLPLLNQSKLVGVLYLENQLAAGVFTPERSQVLQLLSTQAAIAIENANLYSELQAKESKITQFLEAIPVGIAIVDATGHPYYTNQCGNQLTGRETDTSIAPEQISEAYQLYVAGTDQIYPAESLPVVRALKGERIRTEDIEIRRDHVSILIEARGTPVFDQQGNITHAIATFQDITERKQAEKLLADYNCTLEQQVAERTAALRQSEANYRNLLQTANSVIIRYDTQGRIHYINDYGVKLLGYEEHEILGRTVFETIIPEAELSGRDMRPMVHDLLRNPQAYPKGEGENLCRDGRRVWMEWSNQAILNKQGEVVEILSVGNDTTQRKQAEEALQRSEAKFRTIFENSQVGIFRTRLSDGLLLDANQRLADLFGFNSPDEMIGILYSTDFYVNLCDRQQVVELLKRHGDLQNVEIQMRKRDGTAFWGLYSFHLNATDGYVEGVTTDISDRKQAEAALQASEAELRALVSAIPDPMCIFNVEGQVICVTEGHPSYRELYDGELVGKTLHQLFAKEQADELLGYIQQVLRTQQVLTFEYSQWLSGREIWFSARVAPIQHEQVIWLARNIMLQKQAEEASILEERNRMAREIHDTLAQSFTGILAQVGAANQVLTDDVEATQAHLDLIKELARTGLTEARRSVVALRPQLLEEGSLQSALHRLVAQTRAAAIDTTLHYEIEGAVYALPTEVENNLLRIGQEALTNATRHANADEIRVELVYDRDQVCLRVRDNGRGFGVGSISSSEGFGLLGMSERAERIGAQLTIGSQPGRGTEIVVVIGV